MGVNWIDLVLFAIVALAVWLEFQRGFGKAIFDFVAVLVAIKVALSYSPLASGFLRFLPDTQDNQALVFGVSFLALAAILWFIGKLIYDATLISLDTFDPPLGALVGFAVAVVLGHVLVNALFMTTGAAATVPEVIANSVLGYSFLEFPAYHAVINFMSSLTQ
jgi:uncharacterized membrane protein required for colicin V production